MDEFQISHEKVFGRVDGPQREKVLKKNLLKKFRNVNLKSDLNKFSFRESYTFFKIENN